MSEYFQGAAVIVIVGDAVYAAVSLGVGLNYKATEIRTGRTAIIISAIKAAYMLASVRRGLIRPLSRISQAH
jgi:hypothetical protein